MKIYFSQIWRVDSLPSFVLEDFCLEWEDQLVTVSIFTVFFTVVIFLPCFLYFCYIHHHQNYYDCCYCYDYFLISLTLYIVANLKKSCKNSIRNSHIFFTQIDQLFVLPICSVSDYQEHTGNQKPPGIYV